MFDSNIILFISIASVCFGFLLGYLVRGLIRKDTNQTVRVKMAPPDSKDTETNTSESIPVKMQPQAESQKPLERVAQLEQNKPPKINLNPFNILTQAVQSDVKLSTLPEESMVTQVDSILQEKLNLADMKEWAIRLAEIPRRGMVVMVGLEQYNGIDDVPYENVRTIIQESVSEWEQRAASSVLVQ